MHDNEEVSLKECYSLINNIPLRYFFLKYGNLNIIRFSELNNESQISLNSAFDYIKEYFLFSFHKIFIEINKNKDNINKSNKVNQDSINLENFVSYYLWGLRKKVKFNDINIVAYQEVNSIIDMNDKSVLSLKGKIEKLNNNEAILIIQEYQNAKMFDIGILEKKNDNFNLYLIQVTIRKEANERLTLTGLNDYMNYLNGFFSSKFNIKFSNNYFCYIFKSDNPDKATIAHCMQNNIDYFLFDYEKLCFQAELKLRPLDYHLPALKFSENLDKVDRMIRIQKLKFSDYDGNEDETEKHLEQTKKFLQRKRELMKDKYGDIKIEELKKLKIYEQKITNNKNVGTNYERKEFIIDNYLLSNEFKSKKIYGISYKNCNSCDLKFSQNQKNNLFKFCGKKLNDDIIFQINKMEIYNFNIIKPEFGCYILYVTDENKKYYFDYTNGKYYDLDSKWNDCFKDNALVKLGQFYSIMFLDKNINIS